MLSTGVTMNRSSAKPLTTLLATTALAPISWGTTYSVTTEYLPHNRPLLAGAIRALPAGLLLFAFTRVRPKGEWWWKAAVLGTLNIGAFFALLFLAAGRLHGGVAAALGAIQPLIAAGLAAVVLKERIRKPVMIAGVLGVAGVMMIVLQPGARLDALGVAAGLGGAASMACGVTLTKRWKPDVPLLAFTSWQLSAGGILLVFASLVIEGQPPHLTGRNVVGFTWLAVVGTALAYSLWFRGIGRLPIANVTLLALCSPVVAVTIGYAFLGQHLGVFQIAGIIVVLGALWIGQRQRSLPLAAAVSEDRSPVAACNS
jgi:probable blue pigment (indigoidine) exporter